MRRYSIFFGNTAIISLCLTQGMPLYAAQISGEVKAANQPIVSKTLGYTRTRVVGMSNNLKTMKEDLALYLEVKNSLPLKPSSERRLVRIHGQSFAPEVTACVFDEVLSFRNEDRRAVTVMVGKQVVGTVDPREELTFKCTTKGLTELRLKEHAHARGSLFVGTTGVATKPDATGRFLMAAPEGTYVLNVINSTGVIQTTDVEVAAEDIELGLLGAEQTVDDIEAVEDESAGEAATAEDATPPGPKIVTPTPAAPTPPPIPNVNANLPKPAPKALPKPAPKTFPAAIPKPTPAAAPAAVKFAVPKPGTLAAPKVAPAAPKPAAKPAPKPAAKPAPKPAAKPAPKPAAKPAPKPAPAEEEESLDDFFEMEE